MSDLVQRLRQHSPVSSADQMLVLCKDAADEIERLTAERDALRADAERYRWLRIGLGGDQYDAAIDAQIAAEASNG